MADAIDGFNAFWSYAHEDDDRQAGRLLKLASAIQDEFAVTTGDDLKLFLDRRSLDWGDLWRDRIDAALGEAPFFIAIISPKYVRSAECRKELLAFSREAQSRGLGKLLLPILFIDVKDLSEESDDEMLAIIARTQYVDWRALRLKAPDDPEVLLAINAVALKMQNLLDDVAVTGQELEARSEAETLDSISDVVEAIDEKLGTWMEAVEFDHVAGKVWEATLEERLDRAKRLWRGGQRGGPVLATFKKLGAELLPIAADRVEKAKDYNRLTIDLDPLVATALRYVGEHPEVANILDTLSDGVREAVLNIEVGDLGPSWKLHESITHYSQSLMEANRLIDTSMDAVGEANDIVLLWRDKLEQLGAASASAGAHLEEALEQLAQEDLIPDASG